MDSFKVRLQTLGNETYSKGAYISWENIKTSHGPKEVNTIVFQALVYVS